MEDHETESRDNIISKPVNISAAGFGVNVTPSDISLQGYIEMLQELCELRNADNLSKEEKNEKLKHIASKFK